MRFIYSSQTAKVQATSSEWKLHFPNASYHLSNSFSCSQEASYATIYVTSATDFLVVEYRWNKTLFYNKHSKILHRISIVYNPGPVKWINHVWLTYLLLVSALLWALFPKHYLLSLWGSVLTYTFLLKASVSPQVIKLHQVSLPWYEITNMNWDKLPEKAGKAFKIKLHRAASTVSKLTELLRQRNHLLDQKLVYKNIPKNDADSSRPETKQVHKAATIYLL